MLEPGGVPVVWGPRYEVDIGSHGIPVEKYGRFRPICAHQCAHQKKRPLCKTHRNPCFC